MGKDGMAYDLFKFLQKDVTPSQIHEASSKAYESKLPKDLSKVEKPMEEIQQLAEEKKAKKEDKKENKKADKAVNKDIKTAGAGVTEEPEKPKVIVDLEKLSPDAAKLTQDKDGQDPTVSASMKKAKEEKKIEPEVTGVEKVKEANLISQDTFGKKKEEPTIGDKEKEADEKDEKDLKDGMKEAKDAKAVKATSAKEEKKTEEVSGMKAEKAQNEAKINEEGNFGSKEEFIEYLRGTLIPDLRTSGSDATADDFEEAIKWMTSSAQVESKLPADLSKIEDPKGDIQKLAEERVLTTVSDEAIANDMKSKYSAQGARIVTDNVNGKKQFIIMVKEAAEEKKEEKCSCNGADCKGACSEGNAEVTITTDDKEINVNSVDGATQVTTIDKVPGTDLNIPAEEHAEHEATETPAEEKAEQETGIEDEDVLMAEKIYVTELLKVKKTLTEKEQNFIKTVEAVQLDEAKKEKVLKALKNLKNRSKKSSK